MAKLPVLSGKELIKALELDGFQIVRQKGSHVSLQKNEFRTVVPLYSTYQKGHCLAS
jgi:predicted RNA binding protein YcfA (HicA-like mRNA interferase family)